MWVLIKAGDDKEELKGIRKFKQKKKNKMLLETFFFLIKRKKEKKKEKKRWKKHGISMLDYLNCYMSPKSC